MKGFETRVFLSKPNGKCGAQSKKVKESETLLLTDSPRLLRRVLFSSRVEWVPRGKRTSNTNLYRMWVPMLGGSVWWKWNQLCCIFLWWGRGSHSACALWEMNSLFGPIRGCHMGLKWHISSFLKKIHLLKNNFASHMAPLDWFRQASLFGPNRCSPTWGDGQEVMAPVHAGWGFKWVCAVH